MRPYQAEFINNIRAFLKMGIKRLCCVLPTGAGKTWVFTEICKSTVLKNPFAKCIVVVDREELCDQAAQSMEGAGLKVQRITKKAKFLQQASVYVCMVESLNNRSFRDTLLKAGSVLIIDEAHELRHKKILDITPREKIVLGFTGSPVTAKKSIKMRDMYQEIVVGEQIPSLVEQGYLAKERLFEVQNFDEDELETNSFGEFTDESQLAVFEKPKIFAGVLENYRLYCEGEKSMVFCVNQKHGEKTYQAFLEAGYHNTRFIASDFVSEDERREHVQWYKHTEGAVIVNVGMLTKGFDAPNTRNIFVVRATTSLPLWLQICGRGSRRPEGKDEFKIFDFGGNARRLGRWSAVRDWARMFWAEDRKSDKKKSESKNFCKGCGAIIPAGPTPCPYCGHVPKAEEKPVKEAEEKILMESLAEAENICKIAYKKLDRPTLPKIIERAQVGGEKGKYSPLWVVREIMRTEDPIGNLSQYAELMGYSKKWITKMRELYGIGK